MKPPYQSSGSVNQSVVPVGSVPEQSARLAGGLEQTIRKSASNGKTDSLKWIRNQNKRKDWEARDVAVHLGMMRECSRSVHLVCWDQGGCQNVAVEQDRVTSCQRKTGREYISVLTVHGLGSEKTFYCKHGRWDWDKPETENKKFGRETAKETMHFSVLSEERRRHTASVQDRVLKYFVHRWMVFTKLNEACSGRNGSNTEGSTFATNEQFVRWVAWGYKKTSRWLTQVSLTLLLDQFF